MRVKQPARRSVLKAMAATAAAGATSIAMPRIGRAASQKLTVGKSIATLLAYTPIDFGLANNFYQKRGLELEVVSFNGAARMHQAMVSGAIDIALGSGAAMANIGKGEPSLAIAQTLGPPADIAIVVPYDSPIKTTAAWVPPMPTVFIALKGQPFCRASSNTIHSVTEPVEATPTTLPRMSSVVLIGES